MKSRHFLDDCFLCCQESNIRNPRMTAQLCIVLRCQYIYGLHARTPPKQSVATIATKQNKSTPAKTEGSQKKKLSPLRQQYTHDVLPLHVGGHSMSSVRPR